MIRLIFQIIGGFASLWLAVRFVPGVSFAGDLKYLIMAGAVLGLLNFFVKPILRIITLPLRLLTLGLVSLLLNILMVWIIDILFAELVIAGIIPLLWTTLISLIISYFLGFFGSNKKIVQVEG
jgi:putative membrane protein